MQSACASFPVELRKFGDVDVSDDDAASSRSTRSGSASERSSGASQATIGRSFVWADEDSDDDFDVTSFLASSDSSRQQRVSEEIRPSVPQVPPGCNQPFQMGGMSQQWAMMGVCQSFVPCATSACFTQQQVPPGKWKGAEEVTTAFDSRTTLILKNLPLGCSHEGVRKVLDEAGLAGLYNFIYVPFDFKKSALLRYGFVNFELHESAMKAIAALDGFSDWEGDKPCEVRWSGAQQGLQAHVERYRNSPVMHGSVPDECKPVVFENSMRAAFPAPTKTLKPLKFRRAYQA